MAGCSGTKTPFTPALFIARAIGPTLVLPNGIPVVKEPLRPAPWQDFKKLFVAALPDGEFE